jgi:choline-sulfatase
MLGSLAMLAAVAASAPNLVLVTIDTLRADRVGAYGSGKGATPNLDGLAREGVLLEDAVVHVPQTRPSHVTIFTGRLPYEHGIRDNFSKPLDPATPTLATVLKQRGYATGGFIGAYPVSRDSGLHRGFDVFDDPFVAASSVATRKDRSERRAGEVVDRALAWLKKPKSAPIFAWLHVFDPHAPYDPPPPYDKRFAKEPYLGEVAYADAQVGRLMEWLDSVPALRQQTLVVVTSDHGEGLGDHGEDEHAFFIYDTTLRVPLVMRWPGRLPSGARIAGQFRAIDLMPTLLELLGIPAVASSGASRVSALRPGGKIPDNESYAETLYPSLHFGCSPLHALRAEGWKYIDAPRAELYRIAEDPGETRNRLDDRGQAAAAMRGRLQAFDKGGGSPSMPAVDEATLERLAALGYVGGGFFTGPLSGIDPKDRIHDFQSEKREVEKAQALFEKQQFEEAARVLAKLAAPTPLPGGRVLERRSFNVDYYLGRSLLELRRFEDAVTPLRRAVELSPNAVPAHVYLSRALAGAGHGKEALSAIDRGLRLAPKNAELHQMKGRLLLEAGDATAARASLERARALDEANALVRVDLAALDRSLGRLDEALTQADAAVRLAPHSPEAHVARGLVLGAQGREDAAGDAFRAALKERADDLDALYFLGSVELRAGRPESAKPLLARLVEKAPSYPGGREALDTAERGLAPPAEGYAHLRLLRVRERTRADEAQRRVGAGEAFASVARALSEDPSASRGGDLGVVRVRDLAEPLRSAAIVLGPGELSAVIETPGGFILLARER